MWSIRFVALLFTFLSTALADVEFTVPPAGATIRAGDVITAHWKDSGNAPRIAELTTYDLYLCAGGDTPDSHEEVDTLLKDVAFARGNSVSFEIDPGAGGIEHDAYFLKMVASGPEQSVVNFSLRFTLTHMTGSFSPKAMDGIRSVLDSSDYSAELRKRQVGPGGVGGGGDDPDVTAEATGQFTVPYAMQTGPMRYAPMPKKPGSTIPSRSPSRQYPTSAYDIATTYLPKPTVVATVTAPLTYSTSSIENTASPAPEPDAKMKRFLERWKD